MYTLDTGGFLGIPKHYLLLLSNFIQHPSAKLSNATENYIKIHSVIDSLENGLIKLCFNIPDLVHKYS